MRSLFRQRSHQYPKSPNPRNRSGANWLIHLRYRCPRAKDREEFGVWWWIHLHYHRIGAWPRLHAWCRRSWSAAHRHRSGGGQQATWEGDQDEDRLAFILARTLILVNNIHSQSRCETVPNEPETYKIQCEVIWKQRWVCGAGWCRYWWGLLLSGESGCINDFIYLCLYLQWHCALSVLLARSCSLDHSMVLGGLHALICFTMLSFGVPSHYTFSAASPLT
jgi:hypothetical protein